MCFGVVHRLIGGLYQCCAVGAIGGPDRYANTGLNGDAGTVHLQGLGHLFNDLFSDAHDSAAAITRLNEDDKLIPPKTRHGVAVPEYGLQALRHCLKQLVAAPVPVGVVDSLETVEVEEE